MVLIRAVAFLLFMAGAAEAQPQPTVAWLSPLAGVWATRDTYYPVSGSPIVEEATRTCRRVMHDAYLECESVVVRTNGTGRTYRFLINYNRITARFEMLSIWSNHPPKAVHSLTPNASRDRWILEDVAVVGDPEQSDHWSELVIESPDRVVWTGRRVAGGVDPATAPISFQETWTRVGPVARSPLWGGLEHGPHVVGLRPEIVARPGGSPIQVLHFYPAAAAKERWTLASLVAATCVAEGQAAPPADAGACAARLVKELAEYRPGSTADASSLKVAMESGRQAAPGDGRFPLIVFDAGLRADALAHVALAEFLASHGHVVIALPSMPYTPGAKFDFDAPSVAAKARSITAVVDAAARWPNVDAGRVLLAAWSVGGVSTAAVAGGDVRVKGLLSLDAALGYDYGPPLLEALQISSLGKPVLHITGALPNRVAVPKSDAFFSGFGSPAWVATVEGVNHAHFVLQGGVLPLAGDASPAGEQFWRANRAIARLSLAFAAWTLGDARDPDAALRALSGAGGPPATVRRMR